MRKHLVLVIAAAAVLLSVTTAAVGSSIAPGGRPVRLDHGHRPDRSGQPRSAAHDRRGRTLCRHVRLRHARQCGRPGQGRLRARAVVEGRLAEEGRVHALQGHHLLRRDADDCVRRQAEPRLRRQSRRTSRRCSGSSCQSAPPWRRTTARARSPSRRTTPQPFMIQGLAARAARLLEGAGRSHASRSRHRRNRPVQADRRSSRRPLHLRRPEGLHVGAERRHHRGQRAAGEGDAQGRHERDDRGEPPAHRRSQPRFDQRAGPYAAEQGEAGLDRDVRPAERVLLQREPRDIRPPTPPFARRSCRR